MKRGLTGHYLPISTTGEKASAFVPHPLPPEPPLAIDGELGALLDAASTALGRLDGVSLLLPDPGLFLYSYVRKEAVLSSQIEGTQSSLSDLLSHELENTPSGLEEDAAEVSCYVDAMQHGLELLKKGEPLSLRMIRDIHHILLSHGKGSGKMPGEFRSSQNWIGGTRPATARFVPPPPEMVMETMGALELFLHYQPAKTRPLLKAALAHVQFETIHPFLDGNGRLGRLLITFILCAEGVLDSPMLYLSLPEKKSCGILPTPSGNPHLWRLGRVAHVFPHWRPRNRTGCHPDRTRFAPAICTRCDDTPIRSIISDPPPSTSSAPAHHQRPPSLKSGRRFHADRDKGNRYPRKTRNRSRNHRSELPQTLRLP
jgi:fido (protein-threonine AMPylation protein)